MILIVRPDKNMSHQPIPEVTDDDVQRVALRDFGKEHVSLAISILEEYGRQDPNQPKARVRLAILKLADGHLDRLLDLTQVAITDFRDVLALAEYPRYYREVWGGNATEEGKRAIVEDDWRQYHEWLARL